ncbi:hypothetical protein VTJ49DRAFT_4233 [Mycothermus thermophilus]|uniref:Transmembrane protein n=1 Tax=Humicola insolens TaxID=85995 RepID=A0ABR3V6S4_HUMIN
MCGCGAVTITILGIFNLIINILFLIGCVSTNPSGIAIYRVNVAHLAEVIKTRALEDSGIEVAPLAPPELLPKYWNIGMGGVCDNFTRFEVYCRSEFAPSQQMRLVLENSLRGTFRRIQEQNQTNQEEGRKSVPGEEDAEPELLTKVLTSWDEALAGISPSIVSGSEKRSTTLIRVSGALGILAGVTDLFGPVLVIAAPWHRKTATALFLMGGLLGLASGACATLVMRYGMLGAGYQEFQLSYTCAYVAGMLRVCIAIFIGIICCEFRERRKKRQDLYYTPPWERDRARNELRYSYTGWNSPYFNPGTSHFATTTLSTAGPTSPSGALGATPNAMVPSSASGPEGTSQNIPTVVVTTDECRGVADRPREKTP